MGCLTGGGRRGSGDVILASLFFCFPEKFRGLGGGFRWDGR